MMFMNKKDLILKIRFVPSFFYLFLERWLNKMSKKGIKLVHYKGFLYYFEKTEPENRIYFVYNCTGYRKDEGKYSFSLRYPCFEEQYAISKKSSSLNKDNKINPQAKKIIEIDSGKADADYYIVLKERDSIYLKKACRDALIFVVALICCVLALKL